MSVKEQKKNKAKQVQKKKYRTSIKNQLKKIDVYLERGGRNEAELEKMVSEVRKALDKASQKKIIHKNRTSDRKS
jgi:small subunit ribosomal protein S20